MTLPPYTKTMCGVATLLTAALALKLHLLALNDAMSVAMVGVGLLGVGIRHAVGKAQIKEQ